MPSRPLALQQQRNHIWRMKFMLLWRALGQSPIYRAIMFGIGCVFLLITPLVGPLPGPGGIFTFAIGLGLVLRNSLWAKKNYVRFKRWQPKAGAWADWGLRRESAKRRSERDKESNGG